MPNLNFVYYLISYVMLGWYKLFSFVLNPDSGITWALSIIFLVFTIRILLYKPMASAMRSQRKMQEFQPKMAELKQKYGNDQQTMAVEMRKLQKEHGVNPLASCLPMLVQIPVFIGLFHVLRSFNRTGTSFGGLGMSVEANRETANYAFGVSEVQSFLDARLFGSPLSAYVMLPQDAYSAFTYGGGVEVSRIVVIAVAVPLILISAIATHMNSRAMVKRQKARQAADPSKKPQNNQMQMQADLMNKMMLWFMPAMILATGFFWQIGLLIYMVANNVWTYGQQHILFAKMDREEEAEKLAKREAQKNLAPTVGAKPQNPKKKKNKKKK